MGKFIAAAAAVFAGGMLVSAQQPTFRAEINYVELPVRALDAKGNFVRNLKQPDFQVLEDGKPQEITSFRLVDLPAPVPAKATQGSTAAPPPQVLNVQGLQTLEGRLYLFIVDDYHIRPQYSSRARQLVQTFLKDRMGANDAAALVFTSGIKSQDFTQSRDALLSALDRFNGTFDSDEPGTMKEMKARSIVKTVTDFATALGAIKGKHKALIFVTPGVGCGMARQATAEPDLMSGATGTTDLSSEGNGAAGAGDLPAILCNAEILNGVRAAVRADVSVYSLDPRGAQNPGFVSPTIDGRGGPGAAMQKAQAVDGFSLNVFDGMHVLADETGGFVVTGTNSFTKAFDRIVSENSAYYVIGYYSSNDKPDGTLRKIAITVDRPGLQVLYRAAYVAPRQ